MLGGLLLVARRTTLLGALVSIGVLTNVVMLNFCYDVPVKLFSAHLLAMAVFLVLPDLRRLADLLVFNRGVEPAADPAALRRKWLHRGALVLRTVFVLVCTVLLLSTGLQRQQAVREPRAEAAAVRHLERRGDGDRWTGAGRRSSPTRPAGGG